MQYLSRPLDGPSPKNPKMAMPSSPSPNAHFKWNVDASLNLLLLKSAIGGVLRKHEGKFIVIFSSPIPFVEINHAKILAIHRDIKLFSAHDSLRCHKLIVESDSINAVKWCTSESKGSWNLTFIINFIKRSAKLGKDIHFIRKSRESNIVADSLVKQGLQRLDGFYCMAVKFVLALYPF